VQTESERAAQGSEMMVRDRQRARDSKIRVRARLESTRRVARINGAGASAPSFHAIRQRETSKWRASGGRVAIFNLTANYQRPRPILASSTRGTDSQRTSATVFVPTRFRAIHVISIHVSDEPTRERRVMIADRPFLSFSLSFYFLAEE